MEYLYCDICKDYTLHEKNEENTLCSICNNIYDYNKKRYVVVGSSDNIDTIKAIEDLLKIDSSAIIISEDIAFKHRLRGFKEAPTSKYIEPYIYNYIKPVEDIKYSHLSKKEREAIIVPVRSEPKIQRNEKCPCGSGKKYKNCCLKN